MTIETSKRGHKTSAIIVTGPELFMVRILLWLNIFWIALISYKKVLASLKVITQLLNIRKSVGDGKLAQKYYKVNNRYFWNPNAPKWPSKPFNQFISNELNRVKQFQSNPNCLQTLVFAITKKCPMQCKHCSEWDVLNKPESQSLDDLREILRNDQFHNVTQIKFSGGEPLIRINDMIDLLSDSSETTEFWIYTSGYNLTQENAFRLKSAGLTGASISLDHWKKERHNDFRGKDDAFEWVERATSNAKNAGLAVCWMLCATNNFISKNNLMKYAYLANQCRVGFIHILEPRAVGRFTGQEVELKYEQIKILESFYTTLNFKSEYKKMPIITYPGYNQRRLGCFGAGDRYIYIDTDGDIHACPFCQKKGGKVINNSLGLKIKDLHDVGCHVYNGSVYFSNPK
jgi:MoaA/NifB/PqqE/SkfB family radical SAM enzyme